MLFDFRSVLQVEICTFKDPYFPYLLIDSQNHHINRRHVVSTKNASETEGTAEMMHRINRLLSSERGATCVSGPPGPPGPTGPRGHKGARGRRGQKERTGIKGGQGIMGSPGKSGKQGIVGLRD